VSVIVGGTNVVPIFRSVRTEFRLSSTASRPRFSWPTLVLRLVAVFLILHGTASTLGSLRGEAGIPVAIVVLLACLIAQCMLWRQSVSVAIRGLRVPIDAVAEPVRA
jgi:hypothetical protein